MNVKVPVQVLKRMQKDGCTNESVIGSLMYAADGSKQDLDIDELTDAELDQLDKLCASAQYASLDGSVSVTRRIVTLRKLKNDAGGQPIGRLDTLEVALKALVSPLPHKWLFGKCSDGTMLAYYVESVQYNQGTENRLANTVLCMKFSYRAEETKREIIWMRGDLGKKLNAVELLKEEGLYLETDEQFVEYQQQVQRYNSVYSGTGQQFNAKGEGCGTSKWGRGSFSSMERDGQPSKVVLDDLFNEHDDDVKQRSTSVLMVSEDFWVHGKKRSRREQDKEADAAPVVPLPIHPYIQVFRLDVHDFYCVHIDNLSEYQWNDKLISQLVLDSEKKSLIELLVSSAGEVMEDIVKGKTGGVIVASSGPPGVGKTLTAEVYGETVKRALYVVQCSQLGTDEETIENKLSLTLQRATRWGAIYLIDEADVYVRHRGDNIQQNAIVGVFLRTLERYRGIMFLTTNRGTEIDDAIVSRLTAHVKYELHNADELRQIWSVLSTNYKLLLDGGMVKDLVAQFPNISGRGVKNLLKLVCMAVKRGQVCDLDLFVRLAKFQDIDVSKTRELE